MENKDGRSASGTSFIYPSVPFQACPSSYVHNFGQIKINNFRDYKHLFLHANIAMARVQAVLEQPIKIDGVRTLVVYSTCG